MVSSCVSNKTSSLDDKFSLYGLVEFKVLFQSKVFHVAGAETVVFIVNSIKGINSALKKKSVLLHNCFRNLNGIVLSVCIIH